VDTARVAKRLGAEEAVMIYRSDPQHEGASAEAMGVCRGVKIMDVHREVRQRRNHRREMQMLPDSKGSIARAGLTPQDHSLVLAVGEHADLEFLKSLPGVRIGRGDVVEVDQQMGVGHEGIFAGGDMIGGARTMTAAVGHGKKAARCIDAWLRGGVYSKPPKHAVVAFEALNLPVFLDAERRRQSELPVEQRQGFVEVVAGLSEREARYEASRCLSCGNCFECDLLRHRSGAGDHQASKGRFCRYDYDLSSCAVCYGSACAIGSGACRHDGGGAFAQDADEVQGPILTSDRENTHG
jgi:hypothetical protein